jgi:hypothetical protein
MSLISDLWEEFLRLNLDILILTTRGLIRFRRGRSISDWEINDNKY